MNKLLPGIFVFAFIIVILMFFKSGLEMVYYYPKDCIFFELDFSSTCFQNTWDPIFEKNRDINNFFNINNN